MRKEGLADGERSYGLWRVGGFTEEFEIGVEDKWLLTPPTAGGGDYAVSEIGLDTGARINLPVMMSFPSHQ